MEKEAEGVVIEVCGSDAKIRASIHSDCENCGFCPGSNALIYDVYDDVGVEVGQRVLVENKESRMLLAAFTVYILPLLAITLGVLVGYYLSLRFMCSAKAAMALGGIIFGIAGIYLVKRIDKAMRSEKPIIVKTIE